jgi:type II secretory pathway pseudopilin PulG
VNGRQLAAALVVIALLAFVLPPLAAYRVNQERIARAHEDARRIADAVAVSLGPTAAGESLSRPALEVLAGTGEAPRHAGPDAWPERLAAAPAVVSPDPWGNQYLIVVSAERGDGVVVLSAGPNGVVETPFETAVGGLRDPVTPAGDDIMETGRRAAAR